MKSKVVKSEDRKKVTLILSDKAYKYYKQLMDNKNAVKSIPLICDGFLSHYAFEIAPEEI